MSEREDRAVPPDDLGDDPGATYDPRDRGRGDDDPGMLKASWDTPTEANRQVPAATSEAIPDGLARRRLRFRRVVGRGGMGEVWEAVQTSLGRTVAVKRILSSRHSDDSLDEARREFRLEAVITATLEHPNIVPVHDLLEDAQGEPLIAMKMVGGEHWARQCDADFDTLPVAEYLARHLPILVDVGHAVAYAHSRGIVHRDVKLSQVMLGEYGEVLLMDWGLALRVDTTTRGGDPGGRRMAGSDSIPADGDDGGGWTDDGLDLPTRVTGRSPIGTPALMAPEQTLPTAAEVGPWTDVFLLGGCLYRLLTGTYPHQAATGRGAFEVAAKGEIQAPSERAPNREIPPELEDLCLEALARKPEDRTRSAMAFVERLRDFLSGAGKRRESAALVAVVEADLGAGGGTYESYSDCLSRLDTALALWGGNPEIPVLRDRVHHDYARLALAGEDLALAALQSGQIADDEIRIAVVDDVDAARRRRRRKETQRKWALSAVAALLLIGVLGSLEFSRRIAFQRDLAVAARDEAERQKGITFARLEGASSLVKYMLGSLRGRLDLEREKDREVARAVGQGVFDYYRNVDASGFSTELALEHASQLSDVGEEFSDLGLFEESIELLEESLEIQQQQLGQDDPVLAPSMVQLSLSLERLGRWDEAIKWLDRVGAIHDRHPESDRFTVANAVRGRGLVLKGMAEYEKAEAAFRQAYVMAVDAFGEDDPRVAIFCRSLGDLLHDLGKTEEALGYLEVALRFAENDPGERQIDLFEACLGKARLHDQMGEYDRAIAYFERAVNIATQEFGPDDRLVGMSLFGLGNAYKRQDDYARASAAVKRGLSIFEAFYPPGHYEIGAGLGNYGGIQVLLKDYAGAVRTYLRALEIFEQTHGPFHMHTAVAHGELATAYRLWGKLELSREQYLEAVKSLAGGTGLETFGAGVLFNNLALVERDLGRFDDAEAHFGRSLEILTKLAGEEHNGVLQIRMNHAGLLSDQGRSAEALAIVEKVVEIRRRTMGPRHPEFAKALYESANELVVLGRFDDAEKQYREVLDIRRATYGEAHRLTSATVSRLASLLADQHRYEEAVALKRVSLEAYRREFGDDDGQTGTAHNKLAGSLDQAGRPGEALEHYQLALAICRRSYGGDHPETLAVMGNVGSTLVELGRIEEAEAYLVGAYTGRKALGSDANVGLARSAMELARLRLAMGDRDAATVLMAEALGIFESVLGVDHVETSECRAEIVELTDQS
jgi:tetratricopeptide (TPR) repeat protein/tRNA A-37 threonylcarbamoyl transferase component Bud32